jgi:hypothetical protein
VLLITTLTPAPKAAKVTRPPARHLDHPLMGPVLSSTTLTAAHKTKEITARPPPPHLDLDQPHENLVARVVDARQVVLQQVAAPR